MELLFVIVAIAGVVIMVRGMKKNSTKLIVIGYIVTIVSLIIIMNLKMKQIEQSSIRQSRPETSYEEESWPSKPY